MLNLTQVSVSVVPTCQHPTFSRPHALPFTQPTASEHWREKSIIFYGLSHPSSSEGFCSCRNH